MLSGAGTGAARLFISPPGSPRAGARAFLPPTPTVAVPRQLTAPAGRLSREGLRRVIALLEDGAAAAGERAHTHVPPHAHATTAAPPAPPTPYFPMGAGGGGLDEAAGEEDGGGPFAGLADHEIGLLVLLSERAEAALRVVYERGAADFSDLERLRAGLRVLRAPGASLRERASALARVRVEPLAVRAAVAAQGGASAAL